MKTRTGVLVLVLIGVLAVPAKGQSNVVVTAFRGNGILEWTYPTNVGSTSYRVEWASQANGPWARFSEAAEQLDFIAPTGGTMSVAVPMFYRVVAEAPRHNPIALFLLDDYEGDSLGADITDVFRTPTVGAIHSTAWYEGHGATEATVIEHLDGKCAKVHVPQDTAFDYVSQFGQYFGGMAFLLTWDIEVESVNGGGGMFFVRFPRADGNGMQVLFGFLDDGRVIRFSGEPDITTLVPVGTYQAQTRYRVYFIYDLVKASYSVLFDNAWVVDHEPIPGHFATSSISHIGFDINQTIGLPERPAQGNTYYIDNVRFGPLDGGH